MRLEGRGSRASVALGRVVCEGLVVREGVDELLEEDVSSMAGLRSVGPRVEHLEGPPGTLTAQ